MVRDSNRALPYYLEQLDLAFVEQEDSPEAGVRVVHLAAGPAMLQLVEPTSAGSLRDRLDIGGDGLHHVCFGVPDVPAALDRWAPGGAVPVVIGRRGWRAYFLPEWPTRVQLEPTESEPVDARGGAGRRERMGRLDGKIAVITGAGSGIGQGAARAFVREGAVVGLLDRNAEAVEATVSELGERAFPLVADVTDEASIEAAFAEVRRRHGRLDVLYTCAAVQLIGEDAPVHELPIDVWERTHVVNLRGVYLSCKHGVRLMMESGDGGSVINCGSPTGLTMSGAGWHAYSSSKGGVMALTRVMAADYAKYNIRVNGIVPGTIETPLTRRVTEVPELRAALTALHPIGRIGTPEDMAGIAVFLASDESTFATGAHFHVDGGISVR